MYRLVHCTLQKVRGLWHLRHTVMTVVCWWGHQSSTQSAAHPLGLPSSSLSAVHAGLCWKHRRSQKTWLSQCSPLAPGERDIGAADKWHRYPLWCQAGRRTAGGPALSQVGAGWASTWSSSGGKSGLRVCWLMGSLGHSTFGTGTTVREPWYGQTLTVQCLWYFHRNVSWVIPSLIHEHRQSSTSPLPLSRALWSTLTGWMSSKVTTKSSVFSVSRGCVNGKRLLSLYSYCSLVSAVISSHHYPWE